MFWSTFLELRDAFGTKAGLTDRALEVLAFARNYANARRHVAMTLEHVLLGLASVKPCGATIALQGLGMDVIQEHDVLESGLAAIPPQAAEGDVARSPKTQELLIEAEKRASALGHNYVGTEHLMLALLAADQSSGPGFLGRRGITLEGFQEQVLRLLAG